MPATPHPATFLEEARSRPWLAVLAAATLAGLLLGMLGPFGNYLNDGPLLRVGYWVGAMWAGILFYGAGFKASRALAPAKASGAWLVLVISVLIASVPQAALTRIVAFQIWPELARVGPGWTLWYAQVVVIGLMMVLGGALLQEVFARSAALPPTVPTSLAAAPVAAGRLWGDVLALQMEDHYVRVHSRAGSELILMPLGRAIDAVSVDGLRTHRSWWVARHAVAKVEGSARSMSLVLTNGIVAPVSRSSVASLRAAGWIKADQ